MSAPRTTMNITDEEFKVQLVRKHDSVIEDYYRVIFGDNLTVYVDASRIGELINVLKGREQ